MAKQREQEMEQVDEEKQAEWRRKNEMTQQKIKEVTEKKNRDRIEKVNKLYMTQDKQLKEAMLDDKEEQKLRKYVQEGEFKAFKTFEE